MPLFDERYKNYYYNDEQKPKSRLLGLAGNILAVGGGGFIALRTGLLRPIIQRSIVLASRYEPTVAHDITRGIYKWSRKDFGKVPVTYKIKDLKDTVEHSARAHMSVRELRRFTAESSLANMNSILRQLRTEWLARHGIANTHTIDRSIGMIRKVMLDTVQQELGVSTRAQERMLRELGVRFATPQDIMVSTDPKFRRLKNLLVHNKLTNAQIRLDKALFVDKSGQLIDIRYASGSMLDTIKALERHFVIPFANFNPLSLMYLDELLRLGDRPVIGLLKKGELQPFLTGSNKPIDTALFAGGKVYDISNPLNIAGGLNILNEGRTGFLLNNKQFITLQYLRQMAGIPVREHKQYMKGARGFYSRVMRAMDLGYQDIYNWTDPEVGLVSDEITVSSIDAVFSKLSNAFWNKAKPWESAAITPMMRQFLKQNYIYINAAEFNSLGKIAQQITAGRHDMTSVTPLTLVPYIFFGRMNVAAASMGAGVSIESAGSSADLFYNMFLRRALILGGLAFGWHYLNYEMENITGVRPEFVAADAYVGWTKEMAGISDALGFTPALKKAKELFPGGEQLSQLPLVGSATIWMGKSKEEMEDYWKKGEEPIRKGRYWPLGNTPYSGSRIQTWVPNWYRRLKSKWKYAGNTYASEDEYFAYAPLPTPQHPFAPLKRYLLDPYKLEKEHYYDRPYLLTGGFPELEEAPLIGPLLGFIGRLFKPQRKMHPEVWKLIESGIIPQEGATKETYIPPAELKEGRVSTEQDYLMPPEVNLPFYPVADAAGEKTQAVQTRRADPLAGEQWGLEAIGARQAWKELPESKKDVVVAVIDTGVDTDHPDLKYKVYKGYNVIDQTSNVEDKAGHGTHVAGIIAAMGNNGRGIAGAAYPAVKILPIKALGNSGTGRPEDIDRAIDYAMKWRGPHGERVSVINMSLGIAAITPAHAEAIKKAHDAGITVVASAGNEDLWFSGTPAIWPEAISTGALERDEKGKLKKAYYSNYGLGIDIAAPGSDIVSTYPEELSSEQKEKKRKGYTALSGTSMAAPFVAATAAMLKAVRPDLSPDEIRYIMLRSAKDLGPPGEDKIYGAGGIDMGMAVAVARDLDEKQKEKLTTQADILASNIEAQRLLLLNYIANKLGNQVNGLVNRKIVDEYNREVTNKGSLAGRLGQFWENVKEMGGFYGFAIEAVWGEPRYKTNAAQKYIADSRAMESHRRRFWETEIGGLGGELNEILRRAVGRREKWQDYYDPIINTMPSWLPGPEYALVDFHTGDPYSRAGSYGELLLPGGAYEALHHMPIVEMIKKDPLLAKLDRAGWINRFEFYDPLNRFRILAAVAPWSEEYKQYSKLMSQMKLTPEEREEVKQIRERVRQRKKPLRLYPYRFRYKDLKYETVTVDKVIDQNTILTKEYPEHPVRLAGIHVPAGKTDKVARQAGEWLNSVLKPGTKIRIGYDPEEKFKEDTYSTIRAAVWVNGFNLNRALLLRGWAHEKESDYSAPAIQVRYSWLQRLTGSLWERFAHTDSFFHTKLLQVRSAYEDWVRRQVYGKDFQTWERPVSDYIVPTYQSFMARSPFLAVASGMILGSFFGRSRYGRIIGALVGGAVVGAGSLYRMGYELVSGRKWIPERRRKEWEIEQYVDILKYVKYRRLFERETREAKQKEDFDVNAYLDTLRKIKDKRKKRTKDLLSAKRLLYTKGERVNLDRLVGKYHITLPPEEEDEEKPKNRHERRQRYIERIKRGINLELSELSKALAEPLFQLPPHASKALEYYNLMKQTMYGYEPGEPLVNFLRALPQKERRYFQYFMQMPKEEYEKLKEVVPDWILYGLAPMRGEKPPKKPELEEYFEKHFLPDEKWEGWLPNINLQDIKVKIVKHEAMDETEFDVWPDDEARAAQLKTPAPKPFKPAEHGARLRDRLHSLLSGMGISDMDILVTPADRDISIDLDIEVDPTDEIAGLINNDPTMLLKD